VGVEGKLWRRTRGGGGECSAWIWEVERRIWSRGNYDMIAEEVECVVYEGVLLYRFGTICRRPVWYIKPAASNSHPPRTVSSKILYSVPYSHNL
jgi:hypothetical protein